jgi:hypothetical protein
MCGSVSSWVDFGCPKDGVVCNRGSVRVDEVCWVPCCMIWRDSGGFLRVCLRGYGRVWVLICLIAIKMGGVVLAKV